jgi:hypothetical protein
MPETELYPPIKSFLEGQGYVVKSEIRDCDIVAIRSDEAPVIIEMKSSFSLELLIQGVDRLAISDAVYIAIAAPAHRRSRHRHSMLAICRRLGLGLLTVDTRRSGAAAVEAHVDPLPYQPRKNRKRAALLLREFAMRVGDPNCGGSTKRPIVTAYRQDALRCAKFLEEQGSAKLSFIRKETNVARAGGILQHDVYGWFVRRERGIYGLTPKGAAAMDQFADVLSALCSSRNPKLGEDGKGTISASYCPGTDNVRA